MSETLTFQLLGGLTISRAGCPVSGFHSSKERALLCYLVVTGKPHTRPFLAGLFWGDWPERKALGNLRRALTHLRAVAGDHLFITRQTVEFNRASDYWLDVEEFGKLINWETGGLGNWETGKLVDRSRDQATNLPMYQSTNLLALREAVDLYQGDFLAGFYVKGCPTFEEWVFSEQERLRGLALLALRYLVTQHTSRGEYEVGILCARRLLALDSWQEEAHRELMRLLALTGQRSAALAQYYQCRRTLHINLGVLPDEQTETLYRRIVQESRGVMPTELFALSMGQTGKSAPPEMQTVPLSTLRPQLLARLTQAAERAWREYAHDDTLSFLTAALDLVRPDDVENRWELLSTRERVYHFIADRAAQARDLHELETLAEYLADTSRLLALRVRQIQHACRVGEYVQALARGEQALEQAAQHGAADILARLREAVGEVCWNLGDYAAARTHVEQALEYYLAEGDQEGEVRARNGLGNVWRRLGEIDAARREWERALQLYRAQGNDWGVGMVSNNLGALAIDSRDYAVALNYHQQALATRQRLGDRRGEGGSLNNLSMVYYLLGDYETAHTHITAAITLAREIGERDWLVSFLETATRVELARQNYEAASRLCDEGLALSEETGDRHNAAFYHHSAGEIGLAQGDEVKAVTAFDRACAIRGELDEHGNRSASMAGRALARLALNDTAAALADAREAVALVQQTGHAGEYAVQEVWWRAYRIETACGDRERGLVALRRAYQCVQAQAARMQDPGLRAHLLGNVQLHREIVATCSSN